MENITFADLIIGDKTHFSKTVSEFDVYTFAGITGDFNPIHVNTENAKTTMFKGRIAHGMLSAGFISAALTRALDGTNPIYVSQKLVFKAPVKIGDTITATVEIIDKIAVKDRVIFQTIVTNQEGIIVTEGQANIKVI